MEEDNWLYLFRIPKPTPPVIASSLRLGLDGGGWRRRWKKVQGKFRIG